MIFCACLNFTRLSSSQIVASTPAPPQRLMKESWGEHWSCEEWGPHSHREVLHPKKTPIGKFFNPQLEKMQRAPKNKRLGLIDIWYILDSNPSSLRSKWQYDSPKNGRLNYHSIGAELIQSSSQSQVKLHDKGISPTTSDFHLKQLVAPNSKSLRIWTREIDRPTQRF